MKDAPVGFTDLETSAVGVQLANITSRLPEYFDARLEATDEGEERDARTADVVFEPFVTEWQLPHPAAAGIPGHASCRRTMC